MKNVKLQWQRRRYQHASGNYTGFPVTTVEHRLMATLLIWPACYYSNFFGGLAKTARHLLVKKTLFHTAIFFRGSNVITGELPTFLDQSSNSSCVFSFCLKLSPSAFSLCPSTWFSHPLPRTSSTRRM